MVIFVAVVCLFISIGLNLNLGFNEQLFLDPVNIFVIYNYTQHNSHTLGEIRTCLECYFSLYLHYMQLICLGSLRLPMTY